MADVIVIGGGIAGVSAAAALAESGAVVILLEAEDRLAHHTTGRSAALYFENYGHHTVRALSRASRTWFENPPAGAVDVELLSPLGALLVSQPHHIDVLESQIETGRSHGTDVRRLAPAEAAEMVPAIRSEMIEAASWEPEAADMDVAAIHQGFVRLIRRNLGTIETGARVIDASRNANWQLRTEAGSEYRAPIIVNAAGAWCDAVGEVFGARPIGLVPKRRTVFMVSAPEGSEQWPLVADPTHTFYFKPDGIQLLCSPADETPSEPCDARPEEIDIALAIDRINEMTTLGIRSIRSSWAGLRSFVADGGMVVSWDDSVDGFFWVAGQGGTGIQTSPAAGRLAADLILGTEPAVDPAGFDVRRLR